MESPLETKRFWEKLFKFGEGDKVEALFSTECLLLVEKGKLIPHSGALRIRGEIVHLTDERIVIRERSNSPSISIGRERLIEIKKL